MVSLIYLHTAHATKILNTIMEKKVPSPYSVTCVLIKIVVLIFFAYQNEKKKPIDERCDVTMDRLLFVHVFVP